jgi:hypothetical protein
MLAKAFHRRWIKLRPVGALLLRPDDEAVGEIGRIVGFTPIGFCKTIALTRAGATSAILRQKLEPIQPPSVLNLSMPR